MPENTHVEALSMGLTRAPRCNRWSEKKILLLGSELEILIICAVQGVVKM